MCFRCSSSSNDKLARIKDLGAAHLVNYKDMPDWGRFVELFRIGVPIGLTIVAVGTSTPELVTSIMAALRKEADVAFGNVIGSNIYNILGIGGMTALIAPARVPAEIIRFDNWVMIGVSVLAIVLAHTSNRITRWEGGLLLAGYAGYIALLWP